MSGQDQFRQEWLRCRLRDALLIDPDLLAAIDRYRDGATRATDLSGLGALNAVAYIGERVCELVAPVDTAIPEDAQALHTIGATIEAARREAYAAGFIAARAEVEQIVRTTIASADLEEYMHRWINETAQKPTPEPEPKPSQESVPLADKANGVAHFAALDRTPTLHDLFPEVESIEPEPSQESTVFRVGDGVKVIDPDVSRVGLIGRVFAIHRKRPLVRFENGDGVGYNDWQLRLVSAGSEG